MTAKLECLLYQSKIAQRIGPLHMYLLVHRARKKNRALGVTGHMIYLNRTFTHWIEGPSDAVEAVWQRVQRDERHQNVELLMRREQMVRRFPSTPLGFASTAYFCTYQDASFSEATGLDVLRLKSLPGLLTA